MRFCKELTLFILIFTIIYTNVISFDVKFHWRYDGLNIEPFELPHNKRDANQFFDKAAYSFNGLEKIESVPVLFPGDICLMSLNGVKYATSLHRSKDGVQHFAVFKMSDDNYEQLFDQPAPLASAMDCRAVGEKGYVALAYNLTSPITKAKEGSPVYVIGGKGIRAVQYFAATNLERVYLRSSGNEFMLLQTFRNTNAAPNVRCPFFLWSGSTFNKVGHIPCSNARHLELFSIDYENYVAVANYADRYGHTATNSEIYKFDKEKRKFQLFQRIKTNGAVDVRYFSVPVDEVRRQYFLIFGNSLGGSLGDESEADSVFYLFDKGQFVPYQRLPFYAVKKFLPVENLNAEKFLLFVARSNQDIKIYNLNDWKFEESDTQFTEGALSRGVSNMRIYQENDTSYLVIANELMNAMETNVFRPIFKQDEHANSLRQKIIDWSKATTERLSQIDVAKLGTDVEQKLANLKQSNRTLSLNITDIPSANISTVVTKSLNYPRLHFNDKYWKALSYTNQALDALQTQLQQRRRQRRDTTAAVVEHEYDSLRVGTLIVRDQLSAKLVNGVLATQPAFESVRAPKIVITGSYNADTARVSSGEAPLLDDLVVEDLQLTGTLNGLTLMQLVNGTLKRSGDQVLEAHVHVDNLRADTLVVNSGVVNGRPLNQLVRIDVGNYVVQQDVQFAAPIHAKNVIILERLNNIPVRRRQLEVLLRRSNETQVVKGAKRFESLRVMEPITVAGKLLGKHMRAISPISVTHDDLLLHGDYIISGDVSISELLSVHDLIEENTNITATTVLARGIRLDEPLENVHLEFTQPLSVNHSQVSFINALDLQRLVKLNVDEVQVIDGTKVFKQPLTISKGFGEVKQLNGVDVETLEQQLLLKSTNQTIDVPLQLGTVLAKSIESTQITLNGTDLSNFLTRAGTQHINAQLTASTLSTETLQTIHLNTNGKLFNHSLSSIYEQHSKRTPKADIFRRNRKFHGTIYVSDLRFNGSLNGQPLEEIERQLALLKGDIVYVGNFKFNYALDIENLTFGGRLNDIPAADLGRCWLQRTGAQDFTAPQTFGGVDSPDGVWLQGKLNGKSLDDFTTNTYWVDRDEYVSAASLKSPVQLRDTLNTATLNGLRVPEDMLYRSSLTQPQVLTGYIEVHELLVPNGIIGNTTKVNGIELDALETFLQGNGETLHVEHAHFEQAPAIRTLNKHDLRQTLDMVWLANENVELHQHVELAEAHFEGLLDFEGPINNVNRRYLKENYFSRSQPQQINTEIVFTEDVTFKADFHADHLHLSGQITNAQRQLQLNFDEFVTHTLKTSGPHTISGKWQLQNATVLGDLHDVRLNNLSLSEDVLYTQDTPTPIRISKKLNLQDAIIGNLYVTPTSRVSGVDVDSWLRHSVYVNGNYTIEGLTTLDAVRLSGDLQVQGLVNNISFNADNLLLRDREQRLTGSICIRNKLPLEQRVLTNNLESLHADYLNGINITEFLDSQAQLSPTLQVHSHVIFQEPLLVNAYQAPVLSSNSMNSLKSLHSPLTKTRKDHHIRETGLVDVIAKPAVTNERSLATAKRFIPDPE